MRLNRQKVTDRVNAAISRYQERINADLSEGHYYAGFVYVGTQSGYTKIGYTKDCPLRRMPNCGGPLPTQLVAFCYSKRAKLIESIVKKNLKPHRTVQSSEWFGLPSDAVIDALRSEKPRGIVKVGKYKTHGDSLKLTKRRRSVRKTNSSRSVVTTVAQALGLLDD